MSNDLSLSFQINGQPIKLKVRQREAPPELIRDYIKAEESGRYGMVLVDFILAYVSEWNLAEDDDEPVAIERDRLMNIDMTTLREIVKNIVATDKLSINAPPASYLN